MPEPKQETTAKSKPRLLQQTGPQQTRRLDAQGMLSPLRDPLVQMISQVSNTTAAGVHAAMLSRAPASRHGQFLLQLQRQYGNCYVQRVLALSRKVDSEAEAAPEVEAAIHSLNRALSAPTFALGQDIFFRQAEYHPGSSSGQELLAHELTHVVQQAGHVQTQTQLAIGQPGDIYEQEADRVAEQVMRLPQSPIGKKRSVWGPARAPRIQQICSECEQEMQPQLTSGNGLMLQRQISSGHMDDPIHAPLIDEYRRQQGLPPGGVDPQLGQVGPSDAQIKYGGLLTAHRQDRPRGPNPSLCITPLCTGLSRPSPACVRKPQVCAQRWITHVMSCLAAGAEASNATSFRAILQNTKQELQDEVSQIDTWFNGLQPAEQVRHRRDYVDWLKSVCERKQRELAIEFHFNVVFESVPGQHPWAYSAGDWDEVETALQALPDEHLWNRPSWAPVITFRRENIGPAAGPGQSTGGETDPTTGLIRIFDAGVGATPYSRSQGLDFPATYQTLRHEVGHIVEALLVPSDQLDHFFNNIIGWKEYSWHWVNVRGIPTCPATPWPDLRQERCQLCEDLGYRTPGGQCDDARLDQLLANIASGNPVHIGSRTYTKGQFHLASWPTARVPAVQAFEYARTSKSDYFAEIYALATSVPEFLYQTLPADQIAWLQEQVFHTQEHYERVIRPLVLQLAIVGSVPTEFQVRAQQQFTLPQLLRVAQQLNQVLQRQLIERQGGQLV